MAKAGKSISVLVTLALVLSLGVVALPVATPVEASPGTTYYVATTGNDSHTPAEAQIPATPWKTITHAAATVPAGASPGDPNFIQVAAGTYDNTTNGETFPINFNNANVSLVGAGAATTTIDGEGMTTILDIGVEIITIIGFTIENATNGIETDVGGFTVMDNIFSNVGYGVYFYINETLLTADYIVYPATIVGNEFNISTTGVCTNIALDYAYAQTGKSVTIGGMDIMDNTFNMATTTGIDIDIKVGDLNGGTVSMGDVDISDGNEFNGGTRGIDFYGYFNDFTDTTVTVGDITVNDNTFTEQTNDAVYIHYYRISEWDGTSAATFGDLEINRNDITSTQPSCDGIYVDNYAYWYKLHGAVSVDAGHIHIQDNDPVEVGHYGIFVNYYMTRYLYDSASVTLGELSIQRNQVLSGSDGIYIDYDNFGKKMYNDAAVTVGNTYIQDNGIDAGGDGIYIEYYEVGEDMLNSSQFITGEVHIGGTGINEGNTIDADHEAIYIYFEYVANMDEDTTPCEAALYMGDIYIQENSISGQDDGVYIEYSSHDVGYDMYDDAYAELPDYVITGNTFNVTGDGIHYNTCENPYGIYDNSTIDFGGFFIDDNTFNDETAGMDHGIYLENDYFCYGNYDTSTAILGEVTITSNRFYDLGFDAVDLYYGDLGYDLGDESMLEVGDMVIADNVIDGADYGIYIYYQVYAGANNIEPGMLDITGNNISNATSDGIYIYGDIIPRGPAEIYSPTHAWYSHDNNGSQDTTLTGTFDLTVATSPELTFWHWYNTQLSGDGGRVEVDDGSGWAAITPDGGYPGNTLTLGDCYTGDSAGWEQATFDLSGFAGQEIDLRFRYAGNIALRYSGWLVDDISVSEIGFFDDVESGVDGWTAASTGGSAWSIVTLEDLAALATTISENIINDSGGDGICLDDYCDVGITDNLIRGNGTGISLVDSDNIDILYNDILTNPGSASGVHLDVECGANTTINYNNVVANSSGDWGIYNASTNVIDAENNWWGDPSGPDDDDGVINGSGDKISTNVDADPWLTQQSHATIYEQTTTATASGTASVQTDGGAVTDLEAVDEGTLPNAGKPDLTFPHGFFSFNIIGLTPGQTVTVTITLPSAVPVGTEYWKYHASEGGWIQIPMGSDDGDNVITITLVDGGLGDDDLSANGEIVDQGGPGFVSKPPPFVGGVGGEAYPVNKLAILAPWLVLAVLLIGVITWFTLRRRKAYR